VRAQDGTIHPTAARATIWRLTSTTVFDATIETIAFDPRTSDTIYVGGHTQQTPGPGSLRWRPLLYKTQDGGVTWRQAQDGLAGISVRAILVNPTNPDVLYAGVFGGFGVYKSTDRGETWRPSAPASLPWVNALVLDPRNPDVVYVAIGGGGVYKTTDGGTTWAQIGDPLPFIGQLVSSLAVDSSSGLIYATSSGLYRSEDGGASWQLLSSGIGKLLWIGPTSHPVLYALGSPDADLLKSSDGGLTWTPIQTGLPPRKPTGFSNAVLSLVADPTNPDILHAGTEGAGVFRSINGGSSWTPINEGLSNLYVPALAIPPAGAASVYAGTGAGLFDLRARGDFQITIPAVASLHGVPPAFFHSDVWIFNGSADSEATVSATYRCLSGSPCSGSPQTFTIPPRQVKTFSDIAVSLFDAPETAGAVEFESGQLIIVTSRLYTPEASHPTTGMFVPGLKPEEASASQALTSLSHSADPSTGFRTNVGFYNPTDTGSFVDLGFFEASGPSLGRIRLFVGPRQPLQLNDAEIFQRLGIPRDVPDFFCVVSTFGGARIHAYAAVIDNRSQDPIFVPGQDTEGIPESKITLPAAASLRGAGGTDFHSDVKVWNTSETAFANVTARYVCFTGGCGDAEESFLVAPRRMLVLNDVVTSLFHAPDTGGVIEFVSGQPLVVTSRLYTPAPSEPTVGMFVPGLPPGRASPAVVLNGLSHPANFSSGSRVNVGVFNQADVAQVVTYRLFDGAGNQIGQTARLFAAREAFQVNDIFSFLNVSAAVETAYCLLEGNEFLPLFAYAAIIDNRSQDPIFVPGEDDPEHPPIVPFGAK
jgi:photosystem II stability/assembly factor-like uncharacterized protein